MWRSSGSFPTLQFQELPEFPIGPWQAPLIGAVVTCGAVKLPVRGDRDQSEPCRDSTFLKTKLPGDFVQFSAGKERSVRQAECERRLVLLAASLTGFDSAWGEIKRS